MDVAHESGLSEDYIDGGSRSNLLLGETRLLPRDLLKLKTLQELAILRGEADVHLKDLQKLSAISEVDGRKIHELQIKVKAKENEIFKAIREICMESRELCEREENEDCSQLDREMAEMDCASSTLEKMTAKGKLLCSPSCLNKNQRVGKIAERSIKCDSASTGEETMDIVEECSPSGPTVAMFSPKGEIVLPEKLGKIQSEEFKLLEEEKKAAKKMKVALEEQLGFTTKHLTDLRKVEQALLESVSKVSAAHVELSKTCEDPDPINVLAENLQFRELQLIVVEEVTKYAKIDGHVKTKLIELGYNRNLFEPRLKLLKEVQFLTEKRQSCKSSRWTGETGSNFHHGKLAESSAECSFSVDNPAGLDPF